MTEHQSHQHQYENSYPGFKSLIHWVKTEWPQYQPKYTPSTSLRFTSIRLAGSGSILSRSSFSLIGSSISLAGSELSLGSGGLRLAGTNLILASTGLRRRCTSLVLSLLCGIIGRVSFIPVSTAFSLK